MIPQAEVTRLWDEIHETATSQGVNPFAVSSAMTMYSLDKIGTIGRGALSTVKAAGTLFDRHVIDSVDVVSVASPSAVAAIRAVVGIPRGIPFASIGPTTSAALRRVGIEPWVEAPKRSFASLAQTIASQASDSLHQRA